MSGLAFSLAATLLVASGACAPEGPDAPVEASRSADESAPIQERPTLDRRWDLDRPEGRLELPEEVVEASGLAFTHDGARLLVHGDERALVVIVDPEEGRVTGSFGLGRGPVEGDFEGVTSVGPRLFLVTSRGLLYEFEEPEVGESGGFRLTDTGVGDGCEVEGLDHDPREDVLVLACKTAAPPGPWALLHRLPVDPKRAGPGPVRISLAELDARGHRARLHPSGVAVDPEGGYLVVAARDDLLVEVDPDGEIRSTVRLDPDRHPQAEGIAVGPRGRLWIADEAAGRDRAVLTWYAPRPRPREDP